jgi:hypothetical protein
VNVTRRPTCVHPSRLHISIDTHRTYGGNVRIRNVHVAKTTHIANSGLWSSEWRDLLVETSNCVVNVKSASSQYTVDSSQYGTRCGPTLRVRLITRFARNAKVPGACHITYAYTVQITNDRCSLECGQRGYRTARTVSRLRIPYTRHTYLLRISLHKARRY